MVKKPDILNIETIAQTRLFTIEQLDLRFANGVEVQFERIRGSAAGAVLIVPMVDADRVLLIREYAAGSERYELGLPKGRVEDGEDLLAAANRELMEEVGYGARRLRLLKSLSLAPGYLSQTTHVILAQDLYAERMPGDEPEEIEVVPWQLSRLDELLMRDDCTEARSIAALYLVRETLNHDG
ncbi:MAG: ADP compounds hydrolase NudE [Gammaproteobacteria bacterium]